jgi:hypothetical protein
MTTMTIFEAVPTEDDPRQDEFRTELARALAEAGDDVKSATVIPLHGFRASCVDLGWIQDQVNLYVRRHAPTVEDLIALVEAELPQVVQRVKAISVDPERWPHVVEIAFETKDDLGSYSYLVSIPLVDV